MPIRILPTSLLPLVILLSCASSQFVLPPPAPPSADSCVYGNVWIDPDSAVAFAVSSFAERTRKRVTFRAVESFERYQLRRVENRKDAYWRFVVGVHIDSNGNTKTQIGLGAELKLGRHLFVLKMDDPAFPIEVLGSNHSRLYSGRNIRKLNSDVDEGMQSIMLRESGHLRVLCEVRERLIREGLTGIEELRAQLVEEMNRLRRRRAASNEKRLIITIDPDG